MATLQSSQLNDDHFEGGRNVTPGQVTEQGADLASKMNDLQTDVDAINTEVAALGGGGNTGLDAETAGAGGKLELFEATANGTNKVTMQSPAALAADRTITVPDTDVDLGDIEGLTDQANEHGAKDNCRTMSQVNVNVASPGATIEAVALSAGDRVLLTGQSAPAENGIWVWNGAATPMTRPSDFPTGTGTVFPNCRTMISEGNFAGTAWRLSTTGTIDVDTTALTFLQFAAPHVDPFQTLSTTVSVSTSEILNLHSTPKTLVAAPGVGLYVEFVGARIRAASTTVALDDAAAQGNLAIGTPTYGWAVVEADSLVDVAAGSSVSKYASPDGSGTQDRTLSNEALQLENNGGAFTDPGSADTTLDLEVLYRIRSL